MNEPIAPALYSVDLKTKGKMYFFDVRQAKNGNKYLSISEAWIKDGQKHRSAITIFDNNMKEFLDTLSKAVNQVK